jgi:putative Holliday junction resolvase
VPEPEAGRSGPEFRAGIRLGVDVGSVRVGVARSDPAGLLATPVVTLRRGKGDVASLVALAREHAVVEVVVGLPRTLAGQEGAAAVTAGDYASRLARRLVRELGPDAPGVRLVDERLTTVGAQRELHASGVDTRRGRTVIDQAAAVLILQSALDAERTTGSAPGRLVAEAQDVDQAPTAGHDEHEGTDGDVGAGGAEDSDRV